MKRESEEGEGATRSEDPAEGRESEEGGGRVGVVGAGLGCAGAKQGGVGSGDWSGWVAWGECAWNTHWPEPKPFRREDHDRAAVFSSCAVLAWVCGIDGGGGTCIIVGRSKPIRAEGWWQWWRWQ